MRRFHVWLAVALAAWLAIFGIGLSYGAFGATVPTITGPSVAHIGQPATYTGSACTVVCGQTFTVFGTGYSRLGTPFGSGSSASIKFARAGNYQIVYTISEKCSSGWCKHASAPIYVAVS